LNSSSSSAGEVAVKILPCEDDMSKVTAEINFLRKLTSPYVVSFISGYQFDDELWVIFNGLFYAVYVHYIKYFFNVYIDYNGILRWRFIERLS
jgi:hypothetical protein